MGQQVQVNNVTVKLVNLLTLNITLVNRSTDLFSKALDILKVDKRNTETCLITINNFNKFPSTQRVKIDYTFVKKIQWQTL